MTKAQKGPLTEVEGRTVFERVLAFQIFLESMEFRIKTFSGVAYFDRASKRFAEILVLVRSEQQLKSHSVYLQSPHADYIEGLSREAREFFERCRAESSESYRTLQQSSLKGMEEILADMEPVLIHLFYDLRLLSSLFTIPSEHRMRTKDRLIKTGFSEAVSFLETAEQHLLSSPPRPKDTLSNCRLTLESVVHTLLSANGISPVNRFSIDLSTLSVKHPEIIDDAIKQVIQATYGYLSQKGSHIYSTVDLKELTDVNFGVEQTYMVLDQILLKLNPAKGKEHTKGASKV